MARLDPKSNSTLRQPKLAEGTFGDDNEAGGIVICSFNDVAEKDADWLVPGRFPFAAVSVLDGETGLGKSTIAAALMADVTGGPRFLGGKPRAGRNAMYLCHEMGTGVQLKPRLRAAGAKLSKCKFPGEADMREQLAGVSFPIDLDWLEETIVKFKMALVIIDPLSDFASEGCDLTVEQPARKVIRGLQKIAQRTGAAIVLIRHPRKTPGGTPINRGLGSKGIVAAATCVLCVDQGREDKEARFLSTLKNSMGEKGRPLKFYVVKARKSVRLRIEGETDDDPDDLAAPPETPGVRDTKQNAIDLLQKLLAKGPMASEEIKEQAKAAIIADHPLREAKAELGVLHHIELIGGIRMTRWHPPGCSCDKCVKVRAVRK